MASRRSSPSQPAVPGNAHLYDRPAEIDDRRARGWGGGEGFPDPDDPLYGINALRDRVRQQQDVREATWAAKTHLKDVKVKNRQEQSTYEAARRGEKVETDDPNLQQVAQYGYDQRKVDRRQDFVIGLGIIGNGLGRIAGHIAGAGRVADLRSASAKRWG